MTHLDYVYLSFGFGFSVIGLMFLKEILRAKQLKKKLGRVVN